MGFADELPVAIRLGDGRIFGYFAQVFARPFNKRANKRQRYQPAASNDKAPVGAELDAGVASSAAHDNNLAELRIIDSLGFGRHIIGY